MSKLNRRAFTVGSALLVAKATPGGMFCDYATAATPTKIDLIEVAESPTHLWNAVAVTRSGRTFVGMPRWPGFPETPSLCEVLADGSLLPYPGGNWNSWAPGKPVEDTFVSVNSVHVFDDDSLWVVDQGNNAFAPVDGAGKVVHIDLKTGNIKRVYKFDSDVMPKGAGLNDIRINKKGNAYFTESGLGAIIVLDLTTSRAMRRLANHHSTKADPKRLPIGKDGVPIRRPDGVIPSVHADDIELSPDGKWLYYATYNGPLYRIETQYLDDRTLSDEFIGEKVELYYDTPPLNGTAIDSKGNLILAELGHPRISVLSPEKTLTTLIEDERLWGNDALFIDWDRFLYIPLPQLDQMAFFQGPAGKSKQKLPFKILKLKLPETLGDRESDP